MEIVISGSVLSSSGNGVVQAMQGVVASYGNTSIMGQLYAGVALVELMASLTGSLAFAKMFDLGLGMATPWGLGVPSYASAVRSNHCGVLAAANGCLSDILYLCISALFRFAYRSKGRPGLTIPRGYFDSKCVD